MDLTLEAIARYTGGRIDGRADVEVSGYSIDSRTLRRGQLFIAIRGPRVDGHDFVAAAAEAGAAAALVSAPVSPPSGFPLVRVESTLDALHALARAVRRAWGQTVIGVTGSAGKTTTKELVAAVLGRKFGVHRSAGNLNNAYGMPLCLLEVEAHHAFAVLEMGMSALGEIRELASIALPDEGIVTNVGAAHLENFRSVDEIAIAKAELLAGLVGRRRAYLNNADARVRRMADHFGGEIVTYGVGCPADFGAGDIEQHGLESTTFAVRHHDGDFAFRLPLVGVHNVANAMAAIAVGVTHGVGWDDVAAALADFSPATARGRVIRFREGFTVVDDSYNSNPGALREMILMVSATRDHARRILVAGDMLELGPESPRLHAELGTLAVREGIDLIVGVGAEARHLVDGARDAGAEATRVHHVENAVAAGELLASLVEPGDLVLVKGSRGMRLEGVLEALRHAFACVEP